MEAARKESDALAQKTPTGRSGGDPSRGGSQTVWSGCRHSRNTLYVWRVRKIRKGNLYGPGGHTSNNEPIGDVYFTPRLAYGYAEFEIGRLSEDAALKRNAFSAAGRALYLPPTAKGAKDAPSDNLAKEYQLPAIQLIGLLGQIEDLRGVLNRESACKKFVERVGEMNAMLDKFEDGKQKEKTVETFAREGRGVREILLQRQKNEDPEKSKTYASDFLAEVRQALGDQIALPKNSIFTLEQDKNHQFRYAFAEKIAPVRLALTIGGTEKPAELLYDSSDDRDADPHLELARIFVDPDYARNWRNGCIRDEIKPEQEERKLTWTPQDDPMTLHGGERQVSDEPAGNHERFPDAAQREKRR